MQGVRYNGAVQSLCMWSVSHIASMGNPMVIDRQRLHDKASRYDVSMPRCTNTG